jgi:hypothetical protein
VAGEKKFATELVEMYERLRDYQDDLFDCSYVSFYKRTVVQPKSGDKESIGYIYFIYSNCFIYFNTLSNKIILIYSKLF